MTDFWLKNANGLPCSSTVGAIYLFVYQGLEPGSFARALLKQNRESAYARAHKALAEADVDRLFDFVGLLPRGLFDTDEKIVAWKGLANVEDPKLLMVFQLRGITR